MVRLRDASAALIAGGAAWLSQGKLGFATADGGRIGVLPVSFTAIALVLLAMAIVFLLARRGASSAPIALLALVVLPWLPIPLPAAFLLWAGPATLLVWCAVALAMLVSLPRPAVVWTPNRTRLAPQTLAAILAFAVYAISFWQVSPQVPGGDEPHYLVITQSLLKDGDLRIENNHRRGDYRAFFAGELPPHYIQRGRDGEIYSIHAPGLPALVAPVFAIGGYPGVVLMLLVLASLGSALAWRLGYIVAGREDAAWFGWAAATLSATAIFHSFTVYPDGLGGAIVLTGVWALLRAERDGGRTLPWFLHGAALALLPWLHTRFAALAGTLGAIILLRLSSRRDAAGKAVGFLTVPALSALGWVAYFIAIYGRPDPSAPYGTAAARDFSLEFVPSGSLGILFDQRFGVLAYTPVLAFAFVGLAAMLWTPGRRRLALEILFVGVPYFLAVTNYAMWWGGRSAPARFLMPIVPLLAIPSAFAWFTIKSRATRAVALAALAFSLIAVACLVVVRDGALAFNGREGYAQWLDWLNPSIDLARGVPVWFRGGDLPYFRDVVVWIALLVFAWMALHHLASTRALRSRAALATATAGVYAAAATVAVAIVWGLNGVPGIAGTNAQFAILRHIAGDHRLVAARLDPWSRLAVSDIATSMRIEPSLTASQPGAGRRDGSLFQLPPVPAGRYRLKVRAPGGGGWLMVGINERDPFAIVTQELTAPPQPIELNLPVAVRSVVLKGDEEARRAVRGLVVEPLSTVPAEQRLTDAYARRAVRYGDAVAFFVDEGLFAEPEAFWVGGSRRGTIVVQPDASRAAMTLLLRNAPTANRLVIETGTWRDELSLEPGEERHVQVPLDTARGATMITFAAETGFRPSAVNPNSRDDRFLGVWVKIEN